MNKYKNKKVFCEGAYFDSKKELNRFKELRALEEAGAISNLQRQVKYVLIPAQREQDTIGARGGIHKGKLLERECTYIADFVYFDREKQEMIVEDVKGFKGSKAYDIFVIKRKLMLKVHGIRIKEI